jgi:hypothetical protein
MLLLLKMLGTEQRRSEEANDADDEQIYHGL